MGRCGSTTVVVVPGRLRPDGPDVRPVRHPHARGGPQAPVHQQAGQRLGGHLADRLPHLDAHLHLPARPLRPPQGGVRAARAGHRLLRRLPVRPADPRPPPGPRRRRHLGVEELHAAVPVAPDRRPTGGSRCRSSASRSSCGRSCGRPPAGGGSTRCCGGSPG